MIEENICCIRDCNVNDDGEHSALYETILRNVSDLSRTRDSLAAFVGLEEEGEGETDEDARQRRRAAGDTYGEVRLEHCSVRVHCLNIRSNNILQCHLNVR